MDAIFVSLVFLSDPGKPGVRSLGPDVRHSVPPTPCLDLTDVTLADEDTNSILTDNANRAIQGNLCNQCKLRSLVGLRQKFILCRWKWKLSPVKPFYLAK